METFVTFCTQSNNQHQSAPNRWINGGFFIFRSQIFDYLGEGEELASAKGLLLSNIRSCIWSHPRHGPQKSACTALSGVLLSWCRDVKS
jgi:hypothetical protein